MYRTLALSFAFPRSYDSSGVPSRACLIDLSYVRLASPCTDLVILILTSVDTRTRQERTTELLRHYHKHFTDCLGRLGVDHKVYPFRVVCSINKTGMIFQHCVTILLLTFSSLLSDYDKFVLAGFWVATIVIPIQAQAKMLSKKKENDDQVRRT